MGFWRNSHKYCPGCDRTAGKTNEDGTCKRCGATLDDEETAYRFSWARTIMTLSAPVAIISGGLLMELGVEAVAAPIMVAGALVGMIHMTYYFCGFGAFSYGPGSNDPDATMFVSGFCRRVPVSKEAVLPLGRELRSELSMVRKVSLSVIGFLLLMSFMSDA